MITITLNIYVENMIKYKPLESFQGDPECRYLLETELWFRIILYTRRT